VTYEEAEAGAGCLFVLVRRLALLEVHRPHGRSREKTRLIGLGLDSGRLWSARQLVAEVALTLLGCGELGTELVDLGK